MLPPRRALALLGLALLCAPARAQAQLLFSEDFEDGAEDWTVTGTPQVLWHVSTPGECGAVTRMAVYNRAPEACNYKTGGSSTGAMLSPVFTLAGDHAIVVLYDYRQETDEGACIELVDEKNKKSVVVIGCSCCKDPFNSPVIAQASGALPDPQTWAGKKVRLRLSFKADADGNLGSGLMVDNIRVVASGPPELLYAEDFEGGGEGWTMTTENGTIGTPLWHIAAAGECETATRAAAYNRAPAACDYLTRGPNAGRLKSPDFSFYGAPPFTIEFDSKKAMDAKVDGALLQVIEAVVGTATTGGPYPNSPDFKSVFFTLDPHGLWSYWTGKRARLEFAANADGSGNLGSGWIVDDIRVTNSGALPPAPMVTAVEPDHAAPGETTTVVVSGEHLDEAVAVLVGPELVSFEIESETRITAKLAPTAAVGRVSVMVRGIGGSGWLTDGFEFSPASSAPASPGTPPKPGG